MDMIQSNFHHIVRLFYLIDGLQNGLSYNEALHPKGEKHKFLMDIKLGKYTEKEADAIAEEYMAKLDVIDKALVMENISGESSNELELRVFNMVQKAIIESVKNEKKA